ncbi:Translation factor [Pleurostoma richardsiae]|uniref:Threonylcarbamoyl-AMP synthase n=1 Tax=Pleurostoma richardsiae TaxID=41990 RepID=A0AA38RI70_9PEZI|nr:Translation factor [Pleurostoma richardsiae]
MKTRLVKVNRAAEYGGFFARMGQDGIIDTWKLIHAERSEQDPVVEAARCLRDTNVPVAFPTETVYGLGADATRSEAVQGIYRAKNRPADNPLIIHVCDLDMLRSVLVPAASSTEDPIPAIYKELISRFWPGPLTIILPNPTPSKLAPEVTSGLSTFGARMPHSSLALALIKLAGVPIAAPSANASTRPSPTTAQHVLEDLNGRIELILDGGPCDVGVESTVVDGLCDPPVVLRPGGISMEQLRSVPGWEGVQKAYKDQSETGKGDTAAPRAPGMKYKHYSPRAKVILCEVKSKITGKDVYNEVLREAAAKEEKAKAKEQKAKAKEQRAKQANAENDQTAETAETASKVKKQWVVGVIRTDEWTSPRLADQWEEQKRHIDTTPAVVEGSEPASPAPSRVLGEKLNFKMWSADVEGTTIYDLFIGPGPAEVAQDLFSALRELDARGAETIYVEGIHDHNDIGAAVMNRLRKAASEIRK